MRISFNWLRELVDVNLTPVELAQKLTKAGFEVESIEDKSQSAQGVVVGKVVECQPHPNADKLKVCSVDIGETTLSNIVCGAANVNRDIYVPVATLGTYLPAVDLKIRKTKLRGVPSDGMICSLAELGLAKESEGIHIFDPGDLQPGLDVRPLLGLDDFILDLTATANRADALSMVGVAREVAALTGASVRLPSRRPKIYLPFNKSLRLNITDKKACFAYIGTAIAGVKIGPSPEWLRRRLEAAGIRPINNVVDVTNYILLEWGQPLHAFDRERLGGGEELTMGVRFAELGETLKTLDGKTRSLEQQNLLITANNRPVALAGVMGGLETEVHEGTKNIVLEAALFDPVVVRRSSRSQSLPTEASRRYERGVNMAELEMAMFRAIALLEELAGGRTVAQAIVDQRPDLLHREAIPLRLERINQVLGIEGMKAPEVEEILSALGCTLEKLGETQTDAWNVTVPPYRYGDLEREIDLIEEVARLYGYDRIDETLPKATEPGYLSHSEKLRRRVRETFRSLGLTEVVHYSLVKPSREEITLANPLLAEYSALRTDLIDGLIDAFAYNQSQGNLPLNSFEIGRVFWRSTPGLAEEDAIGGIFGGVHRGGKEGAMTWYEAKGMLESAFESLLLNVEYKPDQSDPRLHPGRTASLWLNGKRWGIFGQLHPQLRQERDLPEAVYVFQLSFDVLLKAKSPEEAMPSLFRPYSTYPAAERDIAFFAPSTVSVAQLTIAIKKAARSLLETVELFDVYTGDNVPTGSRSLAFRLKYRGSDHTLTDEEVEQVQDKVRKALESQFQVTLRS
ncbi:MAG: phenylalanine--tRNA ligase subunit beta [Prochloron sp. SP5CPC1]|nr:phenylalanine--tRNA ligase subunit beta [Candidatus Paraprochloron terpiosi SP5CPC1]